MDFVMKPHLVEFLEPLAKTINLIAVNCIATSISGRLQWRRICRDSCLQLDPSTIPSSDCEPDAIAEVKYQDVVIEICRPKDWSTREQDQG
jgi:hypothetical protein